MEVRGDDDVIINLIGALIYKITAGKTTTISMLTGSIPPTSGSITIAGLDIR